MKYSKDKIDGKVFVVGDNVDTDQIIPAKYLNLIPTIEEEYRKLGSYALSGLPSKVRFIREGEMTTEYPIILAGKNFGCGSSREHAPIALGAAGCKVVLARSFARIFFRNAVATGEIYPVELIDEIIDIRTGDEIEIHFDTNMVLSRDGKSYRIKPLGDAKPVIDAGGLFKYCRKEGLIR